MNVSPPISLENEKSGLKDSIPEMESYLENAQIQTEGLQRFIDRAKQVTQLTELTPETGTQVHTENCGI